MTLPEQPGGWQDPWAPPPASPPQPSQPASPSQPSPARPELAQPDAAQPEPSQPGSGQPAYGQASPYAYPPGYDPTAAVPADAYGYSYGYPPGYPQSGYPAYGYGVVPPTNGMAIASMIVSIVGALGICAWGVGAYIGVVGAILGHVARRQIRERGEGGDGMALAGIIIGWIATGIALLATVIIVVAVVLRAQQP